MFYSKIFNALVIINFFISPVLATNIMEENLNPSRISLPYRAKHEVAPVKNLSFLNSFWNKLANVFLSKQSENFIEETQELSWHTHPQGKNAPEWQRLWSKSTAHVVERNYNHLHAFFGYLNAKLNDAHFSDEFKACIQPHSKLLLKAFYRMQNIEVSRSNIEQFRNTIIKLYSVLSKSKLPNFIERDYRFYKAILALRSKTETEQDIEFWENRFPLQGLYEQRHEHTIFQEGFLLASCLESIGSLERRQTKLGILQGYIKDLYTDLDKSKLHKHSYRILRQIGIDVQIPRKVDWSRIHKAAGFVCLLGASSFITAAAAQRPQFLEDACSGSFEECRSALALIDCCGYQTEINTILSTGYLNNALQFNLVRLSREESVEAARSIAMIPLNNNFNYYSEIVSHDIPSNEEFVRELFTISQPYTGTAIMPISDNQYNRTTYNLYGVTNPQNFTSSSVSGSSKPFYFAQNPNADNWLFTITDAGRNFGLVSFVVRSHSSTPYSLWTRFISNVTADSRVIPGNLPTSPVSTAKPSSAIERDDNNFDEFLNSLYSGYVDNPEGQNSRTIERFAADNGLIPPGLIDCFSKVWLYPLSCAQFMGNGYTRFTTFYPEQRSTLTFVSKNTVDGPRVNNLMYEQLNSTTIRVLQESYQWNPILEASSSNETIELGDISGFRGSLSSGVVKKIAELYLPNSTAAIVLIFSQSSDGNTLVKRAIINDINYYALLGPEIIAAEAPPFNNSTSSGPNKAAIIGGAVGGGVGLLCVVGTTAGVVGLIVAKKYHDKNQQKEVLKNPDDDIEKNNRPYNLDVFNAVEGEGLMGARMRVKGALTKSNYAIYFKVNRSEAEDIYEETGYKVDFPDGEEEVDLILGKGNFGQVRVVKNEVTGEYFALKIVAGTENVRASQREGKLQALLVDDERKPLEGVLPLIDYLHYKPTNKNTNDMKQLLEATFGSTTIEDNKGNKQNLLTQELLLQITPLAGFGNGKTFQRRLAGVSNKILKEDLVIKYALGVTEGLKNMRDRGISHFDFKLENSLLLKDGKVKVCDLGCALMKDRVQGGNGDARYFAPERLGCCRYLLQKQGYEFDTDEIYPYFSGQKNDQFAFGLALLELSLNKYPLPFENGFLAIIKNRDQAYFDKHLKKAYKEIKDWRILSVIQGLLQSDPDLRWDMRKTHEELLKLKPEVSSEELFETFRSTFEKEETHKAVNKNTAPSYSYVNKLPSEQDEEEMSVQQAYGKDLPLLYKELQKPYRDASASVSSKVDTYSEIDLPAYDASSSTQPYNPELLKFKSKTKPRNDNKVQSYTTEQPQFNPENPSNDNSSQAYNTDQLVFNSEQPSEKGKEKITSYLS